MSSERKLTANRANLRTRKGLTPAGRQRLREAALRNRPWEVSTGPRTAGGKARSRGNAWKHGWYEAERRARRRLAFRLLAGIRAFRVAVREGASVAGLGVMARDLSALADEVLEVLSEPRQPSQVPG